MTAKKRTVKKVLPKAKTSAKTKAAKSRADAKIKTDWKFPAEAGLSLEQQRAIINSREFIESRARETPGAPFKIPIIANDEALPISQSARSQKLVPDEKWWAEQEKDTETWQQVRALMQNFADIQNVIIDLEDEVETLDTKIPAENLSRLKIIIERLWNTAELKEGGPADLMEKNRPDTERGKKTGPVAGKKGGLERAKQIRETHDGVTLSEREEELKVRLSEKMKKTPSKRRACQFLSNEKDIPWSAEYLRKNLFP